MNLVNMQNGAILGTSSFENPQRFGGSDVMNRISYETGIFKGELQSVLISGINFEIGELCKQFNIYTPEYEIRYITPALSSDTNIDPSTYCCTSTGLPR